MLRSGWTKEIAAAPAARGPASGRIGQRVGAARAHKAR